MSFSIKKAPIFIIQMKIGAFKFYFVQINAGQDADELI